MPCAAALRAALLAPLAAAAIASQSCMSTEHLVLKLPDTPLANLNPWLRHDPQYKALLAAGCSDSRPETELCFDKPAIGSGLAQLAPNHFLAITDRGPNQDCAELAESDPARYPGAVGKSGKGFPLQNFSPTLVYFSPDQHMRQLVTRRSVPLRGADGKPISGLSNSKLDQPSYGAGCAGEQLPYDPSGLDTEDLARITGTDYVAIVEEYSPSVVIANFKNGKISARHVPTSLKDMLAGARYPIVSDIPAVYANRRQNRGFEGVVVDAEGKYVIAILQSPMLGEDEELTKDNAIIRCAYFDITISKNGIPTLKYAKSFIIEASQPSAYENTANNAKDMKYSAAQYAGVNKLIALERAKGQVKLFLVDFSNVTNIDETQYRNSLDLEIGTNGVRTAQQLGILSADKTLIWDSLPIVGGTLNFDGVSKQEGFVVDRTDPTKIYMIDDNDFGLGGTTNAELRVLSLGRSITGSTVCPMSGHPPSPRIDVHPSNTIKLRNSQTYRVSNSPGAGAAESLDVDVESQMAYVANDDSGAVDMYDTSTSPFTPKGSYMAGAPYKPTSTSVCEQHGVVAVGLANAEDDALPGRVDFLNASNLTLLDTIADPGCVLVDHVKFSSDCKFLVAACEGEGADVPGAVLVVEFMGSPDAMLRSSKVADFSAFDEIVDVVKEQGIRLIQSDKPSVDFEPEYSVIVGRHAFVTIQEANAIAVVDLYEAKVTELKPIGFIDHSRKGFGLDASNKDDKINIRNYPTGLYGIPQPDSIASYVSQADGNTYLVFANEGDAKDAEEARCADIMDPEELNRKMTGPLAAMIKDDALLGRLKFSTIDGYNAETNTQEEIYHFGSRSFSIMALNGTVVYDSGEFFARIQEALFPEIFNSNSFDEEDLSASQADLVDSRSDEKGSEPESVSVMTTDAGMTYAFIGLERPSIIVIFDITSPTSPTFVTAVQNHPYERPIEEVFSADEQGDLDPEGLFASAKLEKLFVSGSVSNSVTVYQIEGM